MAGAVQLSIGIGFVAIAAGPVATVWPNTNALHALVLGGMFLAGGLTARASATARERRILAALARTRVAAPGGRGWGVSFLAAAGIVALAGLSAILPLNWVYLGAATSLLAHFVARPWIESEAARMASTHDALRSALGGAAMDDDLRRTIQAFVRLTSRRQARGA